jgi:hypothetical protein
MRDTAQSHDPQRSLYGIIIDFDAAVITEAHQRFRPSECGSQAGRNSAHNNVVFAVNLSISNPCWCHVSGAEPLRDPSVEFLAFV